MGIPAQSGRRLSHSVCFGQEGQDVKSKNYFRFLMILLVSLAFVCTARAQNENPNTVEPGPPKFLNMVHLELKPERTGAHDDLESSIVHI